MQFLAKKPKKEDLKIFALADAKTFYVLNVEVYVGTQPSEQFAVSNSSKGIVMRLCEPIFEYGCNIIVSNWFSSLSLLEALFEKKLTLLSTIRKNRKEISKEFAAPIARPLNSSMFSFHYVATLSRIIPKHNENV